MKFSDPRMSPLLRKFMLGLMVFAMGCSVESRRPKLDGGFGRDEFKASQGTVFRVDTVKVSSLVTSGTNEFGMPSAREFNLVACLKDLSGVSLPQGLSFAIQGGGKERLKETDGNGCVSWSETLVYNHLRSETYFRMERRLVSLGHLRGDVTVTVALNPWNERFPLIDTRTQTLPGSKSIDELPEFGGVGTRGDSASSEVQTAGIHLPEIRIDSLGLDAVDFEVTPLLGLKITHRYRFNLQPVFLRKNIGKGLMTEPIMSGRFKVYVALIRETGVTSALPPVADVISSTSFEEDVINGKGNGLVSRVNLKFDDVSQVLSRSLLVVTLQPLGDLSPMGESSFYGVSQPGYLRSMNLSPTQINAREILQLYQTKIQREQAASAVDLFKSRSGFRALSDADVEVLSGLWPFESKRKVAAVRKRMIDYIRSPERPLDSPDMWLFGKILCEKLFDQRDEKAELACMRNPWEHLKVGRRRLVTKILSRPKRVMSLPPETIRTRAVIEVANTQTTAWKASVGAGLSFSLGPSFGDMPFDPRRMASLNVRLLSGGAEASYVIEQAQFEETRASSTAETEVTVDGARYEFDIESMRCLIVQTSDRERGGYYCLEKIEPARASESYYLVNSTPGVKDSPFTDGNSALEGRWRSIVRGQGAMSLFRQMFTSGDKSLARLVISRIPDRESLFQEFREYKMTQEFPGLLAESAIIEPIAHTK